MAREKDESCDGSKGTKQFRALLLAKTLLTNDEKEFDRNHTDNITTKNGHI